MRRVLLVSTAVLGLASLPALAQQAEPVQPAVPGTGAAPAEAPAPSAGTTAGAPAPKPIPEQAEHQVRAQSLLGVDVSNGQDTIGEVSDLVVTDEGRVEAIVVGVGGFLGIGQKSVALAWDSIKLTEQDGDRVILVSATREQLEGMPTYKTLEEKQAEADAAAAQQQLQQQQQGVAPGVGVAPAPAPAPAPSNQ
jgi:PRC-barrel domain